MIRTRFESLDGGAYRIYLLVNPSMAGGGANDNAWWDGENSALMASGQEILFGKNATIVSGIKIQSPNDFIEHSNGYAGNGSDCLIDLRANKALIKQFDKVAKNGNVVQCGRVGNVESDTTFTVALGYGGDAASAVAQAKGSLQAGFGDREKAYKNGWNTYLNKLRTAPASVENDVSKRQAYYVAAMALHSAEDKTYLGASVAGFATPWGDFVNGDYLNDGYHRVWGRDLYQQATGLMAAGDFEQAQRMAKFLWENQYISANTAGSGTTYPPGAFPRYSPVSGVKGVTPDQLGCCEQFDQDAFAILLAWMTGVTDSSIYQKIKETADHIQKDGPDTTERWEEQHGKSVSSIAAEIAGLVAAADIARENGDVLNALSWEVTAEVWRTKLVEWTFTTSGFWGNHQYYERIDQSSNPNDTVDQLAFQEGNFYARDIVDFGFLDLVRLGVHTPNETNIATSLAPTAEAFDGNSKVMTAADNGDIYFHRYNHDNYGESNLDCSGWPANNANRFGRIWPVLSGERGEYELANNRSAAIYLKSMADAQNDGRFIPEQIWDRKDIHCFDFVKSTGSAAPLNWAEGEYLRLAQSIDLGYNYETPSVVKAFYRSAGPIMSESGKCIDVQGGISSDGTPIQLWTCNGTGAQNLKWSSADGTLQVLDKCLDTGGSSLQLLSCNGSDTQKWRWRRQNRLVNPKSGTCLTIVNDAALDGTRLKIADCNDNKSQAWHLP